MSSRNTVSSAKAEWDSWAIGRRRQREMSEEALSGSDQPTQTLPLRIAGELELRRVVDDQDLPMLGSSTGALVKMRRQDRLGRHAVIAEEPIRGPPTQCRPGSWESSRPGARPAAPRADPGVDSADRRLDPRRSAQTKGWNPKLLAGHARRGSQPGSPDKMCRIVRGPPTVGLIAACWAIRTVKVVGRRRDCARSTAGFRRPDHQRLVATTNAAALRQELIVGKVPSRRSSVRRRPYAPCP